MKKKIIHVGSVEYETDVIYIGSIVVETKSVLTAATVRERISDCTTVRGAVTLDDGSVVRWCTRQQFERHNSFNTPMPSGFGEWWDLDDQGLVIPIDQDEQERGAK